MSNVINMTNLKISEVAQRYLSFNSLLSKVRVLVILDGYVVKIFCENFIIIGLLILVENIF